MADTELQVLEFELGAETYCVDIGYVAEIVDTVDLTSVPNSPSHVEGVMDLRGRTTSIVNPKTVLNVNGEGDQRRIIVFDPDEAADGGAVGWLVDEVAEVVGIDPDDADDPPNEDELVNGILPRDDEFVIWLDPESLNA